ncbi:MAG: hemerythrin family protein [Gammaproteobacteria bacterium]|nr:hemerythrin family protein [Gammaproteobacteria bacterium]
MSIIDWMDEQYLLGIVNMDNTHKEFVSLVNQLAAAADTDFATLFDELITHTQAHFLQEEKLMMASNFPAYAEHNDEHARILGELNQFKKRVDKGLIAFGRNYIKERMPDWFALHAATMDSALAMDLKNTGFDVATG